MANAVAEVKKDQATVEAMMYAATGDPDAKRMGIAKDGGLWFKNYYTDQLYRVDEDGKGGYEVKETKHDPIATKKTAAGPSRAEMMQKAKGRGIKYYRILSKLELSQVLAEEITPEKIAEIQREAVERWKGSKEN
jgi:hypothetical protein